MRATLGVALSVRKSPGAACPRASPSACHDRDMADAARGRATYAEYVAGEGARDIEHEDLSGLVVAMAGGSIEHRRLVSRMSALLSAALEDRPCAVRPADARVRIPPEDGATYPDLHVVRGDLERDPDDPHAVVTPLVIVEVLSESTSESDWSDIVP